MSGSQDSGEKTQDPTEKRLEDARKKGEIAKSDEVGVAGAYLGLIIGAVIAGPLLMSTTANTLSGFLDRADYFTGVILGPGGGQVLGQAMMSMLAGLWPIFVLPAAAAFAGYFAQRAITVAGSKLAPKLSRLSPISAVQNKLGPTGLVEFAKRFVKMSIVSITAFLILVVEADTIVGSISGEPAAVVALMADLTIKLLIAVSILAAVIAAVDLVWVRFDHARRNRMSFQELRDETKESEGDPMLKARRRRRGQEIARNQMMAKVPTADVVIVNPTHVAIALKWSRDKGTAPVCVAKGRDAIALTIRTIAEDSGVPIHHDPPTARALYDVVELDHEVPVDMYRPVAAAIRFSEDMRRRAKHGPLG